MQLQLVSTATSLKWHVSLKITIHLSLFSPSAGLQLLAKHAFQFSSCFMDHYRPLYEVMSTLCGHINPEMKRTSSYALEAFLKQVKTFSSLSFECPDSGLLSNVHNVEFCRMVISLNGIHKELSETVFLHHKCMW